MDQVRFGKKEKNFKWVTFPSKHALTLNLARLLVVIDQFVPGCMMITEAVYVS